MRVVFVSLLTAFTVLCAAAFAHGAQRADPILHATKLDANGKVAEETWTDWARLRARTINYDTQGRVVGQSTVSIAGNQLRTQYVNYQDQQLVSRSATIPPSAHHVQIRHSAYFPEEIRELVNDRIIGLVGRPMIAGQRTLQLQGQTGPQLLQVWVEPRSYRVVQVVVRWSGRGIVQKLGFDWLARTPANQAKLKLTVPPGFQRVG